MNGDELVQRVAFAIRKARDKQAKDDDITFTALQIVELILSLERRRVDGHLSKMTSELAYAQRQIETGAEAES